MKAPATFAVVAFLLTAALAPAVIASPTASVDADPTASVDAGPTASVDAGPTTSVDAGPTTSVDAGPTPATASLPTGLDDASAVARYQIERHQSATTPPAVLASNNTTRRLGLQDPVAANYSTVTLDFAATMSMDSMAVETDYHVSLVAYQIGQANSRAETNALVNAYLDTVVERLDRLEDREVRAVQRYNSDQWGSETLLVELARIDQQARAMEETLRRVQIQTDQLTQQTSDRFRGLDVEINSLQSPIRQHVATVARGNLDGPPNQLRVTTSQRGAVLEMIDGDTYYRSAVRHDNRDLDGQDQIGGISEFQDRVSNWYAWGYANRQTEDIDTLTDRNLYSMTFQHPHGSLVTYFDGATASVYREHQSLVLDRLPTTTASTTTANNVTVTLTRTEKGGPFLVNVTHTTTGEPIDGVVLVDGQRVGRTADDGLLWVLEPRGAYDVTVVKDGTTINVSVAA